MHGDDRDPERKLDSHERDRFAEHVEWRVELEVQRHQRPKDGTEGEPSRNYPARQGRLNPVEDQTVDDTDHGGNGHVEWTIGEHEREWLHLEQNSDDFCALSFVLKKKRATELKEQDVAHYVGNDDRDSTADGGSK